MLSEEDMNKLKEIFILKNSFKDNYVKDNEINLKKQGEYISDKVYLNENNLNKFKHIKVKDINNLKDMSIKEYNENIDKSIDGNMEKDTDINIIDKNRSEVVNRNREMSLSCRNVLKSEDIFEILRNEDLYKDLINIIEKNCKVLNKDNLINDLKKYFYIDNNKDDSIGIYIKEENIQLNLESEDWREAIKLSAAPLLKNNYITEDYVKAMINNVENLGPYIVVDDGIAIPHAKPGKYVNRFGITINTFKTPIAFGSHKNVRILITIASVSSD